MKLTEGQQKIHKAIPEQRTSKTTRQHQQAKSTYTILYICGVSEAVSRILTPLSTHTVTKAKKINWKLIKGAKDTKLHLTKNSEL